MYIAFYKRCDNILDRLIRYFTKSEYIHCEIVTEKLITRFLGYSAFPFEGVRGKWVSYCEEDWDFVEIPSYVEMDLEFVFDETIDAKYDYLGVLGFVFGNRDNRKKYFCSEWIAMVLDLPEPSKISPAKLYELVKEKYNDNDKC